MRCRVPAKPLNCWRTSALTPRPLRKKSRRFNRKGNWPQESAAESPRRFLPGFAFFARPFIEVIYSREDFRRRSGSEFENPRYSKLGSPRCFGCGLAALYSGGPNFHPLPATHFWGTLAVVIGYERNGKIPERQIAAGRRCFERLLFPSHGGAGLRAQRRGRLRPREI